MTWTILLIKKPHNGWFVNYIENKLITQIEKFKLENFIDVMVFEPNMKFFSDYVSVIEEEIEISDNFIDVVYNKIKNGADCIGLKGIIRINNSPYYFNNISKNDNEIYLPTTKLNPIKTKIIFNKINNIIYYINSEVLLNLVEDIDSVELPIIFLEKTVNVPISIIVTAYQTQNYIEECLDSIEKQTYFINNDNFEVLVGVDACQETFDKLEEIKHKYRNLSIYMMSENKGTYITTNTLIDLVKNENVIRFDSDDIMTPNLVMEVFKNKKNNDIIMLGYVDIKDGNIDSKLCVAGGIIYFKKSVMDDIAGGYQPWTCAADSEMMMRLMNKVKISQINKILFYRRIHDNSLTKRLDTGHNSDIRNKYAKQIKPHYKDDEIKIERVINEIVKKNKLEIDKFVSVNIATYPERKISFIRCINQLLNIDVIDIIRVYLNEYKNIPKEFPISEKIKYFIGEKNLKDSGKFYWASENNNEYYFTIDDDFLYSNEYFLNHIKVLKEFNNKIIVTLHGKIMNDKPTHFNDCKVMYHFAEENKENVFINNGGTGVMAFDNSIFSLPLDIFKYHGMCDLWVALYCQKEKIPIICRSHNKNELIYLENKNTLYNQRDKMAEQHLEILNSIEKWNLYDNKIPKRMFFYWGGSDLSWMRYMTLYSFKKMNPDWEVILYVSDGHSKNKGWKTKENQDYHTYNGQNYFNKLEELNIKIEDAEFPAEYQSSLKNLSPIHKSDLFRYYQLYKNGGIYCDMDVLFFKPIDIFYDDIINKKYNTIIHEYKSKELTLTIGFLGSSINNTYYKDLFNFGIDYINKNEIDDNYQSMGVQLIYRMLTNNRHATPVYDNIISKYPYLTFYNLPTSLIYKFDWTQIKYCFTNSISIEDFDKNSIGYHWYGGGVESQKYNNILNENNYTDYETTFSTIANKIINKIPKVSIVMSTFNRSQLLNLGLKSILNQKIDYPFEIIVVNDGMEDDTEYVCNLYKNMLDIKYIFSGYRHTKELISRNPAFALNIGIKQSDGDVVILTCPEIYHLNNCINKIVDPLVENRNYLTIPNQMYFDDSNIYTKDLLNNKISNKLYTCEVRTDHVVMPFLLGVWKRHLLDIGGYDEDFIGYAADDNDLIDRLKLKGCEHYRTEAEIVHLYHGKRASGNVEWNDPDWVYNYKLYNDRKNILVRNTNRIWGRNIKISIITAYYNRKNVFYETLKSISKSNFKEFELIVVDDCSSSDERLEDFLLEFPFLKIIRLEPENKWYVNPCVPFNIGIREAIGSIIILQNPECLHVHDILSYVNENINDTNYITISAYALDEKLTKNLPLLNNNDKIVDFLDSLKNDKFKNKTFGLSNVGNIGWYNHSIYLKSYFHFCSAITKKNMDLLGGFDERYANGISYDDNEFVDRVDRLGLNKIIVDDISVIHQYHRPVYYEKPDFNKLHTINKSLYENITKNETTIKIINYNGKK